MNPEIMIIETSANTPLHNVNGSDGLGLNGCGAQQQVVSNNNEHLNHQAIENTGNESNNEQTNDNQTVESELNQGSNNESQHEYETKLHDNGNTKLREIGSSHTSHPEQELRNPNISQSKGQPPLITIPPELGQVRVKVVVPKQEVQQTNDHDIRSKINIKQYGEKIQIQPQLKKTSPQNISKAKRPVQDQRNRNRDPTLRIRQKQISTS
ncbi:MAG: hypothetical protein EZS28_002333 [Streblomastix strix]|uniref:Uncharacterized protein n=1 Tax=Streblomastix strix TaxID=222440 RepID=A0A5J4X680_9EUKA|nr:MAG: hypothetical protein EZS28_002333 [Streblomastix strix]